MNKEKFKELIIRSCPNVSWMRKGVTRVAISYMRRFLLPDEMIESGEADEHKKDLIVSKMKRKWNRIYSNDDVRIDIIFQTAPDYSHLSQTEKNRIRNDIHFCRFAYGFMPEEYVCYNLKSRTTSERKGFISETDHMVYCQMMNDPVDYYIFGDKMKTYQRFNDYYKRDAILVAGQEDYKKYKQFIDAHPVFVKKQVYESCGNSIELINLETTSKTIDELFESFLKESKVILEELVVQSEATSCFNKSSVNTVRCMTFNTNEGVITPYCFMKIGREGAFVDNGGAGGILVGIDENTGILNTYGYDEKRYIYSTHPDSGIEFIGHQLPEWNKMISMCKEMAYQVPSVRFIGWDLAYDKNKGWVVIEGNGQSQFIGPQTIWEKGIKDEVKRYMKEMNSV